MTCVGAFILLYADVQVLSLALVRLSWWMRLRRLCRRGAFGLAVPLGFGWVLGVCLAWMRLTGLVLLRRLCRRYAFGLAVPLGFGLNAWPRGCAADTPDIAALFPLTNNRPLSEGAAGASRLGEL